MLISLAFIFIIGLTLGDIFKKLNLPSLIGMLITGILLGPYALNLIDDTILSISSELRQIALVIILMRAGLSLNLSDLKKVGRPALLMCFLPACAEIVGMILLAPKLLGITILEAAIMGSVVAAVSPAVIVPRMIKLIDEGYGLDKSIPQLIMAGAAVDDVFVIILFSSFTSLAVGNDVSLLQFTKIPISIILGIIVGIICGYLLTLLFKKYSIRDTIKIMLLLSVSFILLFLEDMIPMSGLLAIMTIGITLLKIYPTLANRISIRFNKLWIIAEVLLFVLVGATVDIQYALSSGITVIILVVLVSLFRVFGVFICLLKTSLSIKEKLFCMIAYLPKATVQAAIGGIPLTMGLPCGEIILTVAVISILITAPLGALGIDLTYDRVLQNENKVT